MDKYLFFATFSECEEGGYAVSFYDLPGCYTCGDDIEEAIKNAKEVLELHLYGMEEDNDKIPKPTKPSYIKLKENEFVVPITVFMKLVREEMINRAATRKNSLEIVFIRHGKPDYESCDKSGFVAQGYNLAPLSEEGINQAEIVSQDSTLINCDLILSSPYTRALQTAAIISKNTGISINVETDLHEWLPDKKYEYKTNREFYSKYKDFIKNKGICPEGVEKSWETTKEIQTRVTNVLKKYISYKKIIVVCHEEVIKSILNISKVKYCETYDYKFSLE